MQPAHKTNGKSLLGSAVHTFRFFLRFAFTSLDTDTFFMCSFLSFGHKTCGSKSNKSVSRQLHVSRGHDVRRQRSTTTIYFFLHRRRTHYYNFITFFFLLAFLFTRRATHELLSIRCKDCRETDCDSVAMRWQLNAHTYNHTHGERKKKESWHTRFLRNIKGARSIVLWLDNMLFGIYLSACVRLSCVLMGYFC